MFVLRMQRRVVEHGGADAELAVLCHQDFVVDAALTSFPERGVIGQFVESGT